MKLEWYGEQNCRELRRSGLFMLEMTVSAKACRSRQSWFTWGRGQQPGMVRLLWSDHLSCWDEFRQAWGDCKGEWVQPHTHPERTGYPESRKGRLHIIQVRGISWFLISGRGQKEKSSLKKSQLPSDTEPGPFIVLSSLKHRSAALPDMPWADLAAPALLELQWRGPGREGKQLYCVTRDA